MAEKKKVWKLLALFALVMAMAAGWVNVLRDAFGKGSGSSDEPRPAVVSSIPDDAPAEIVEDMHLGPQRFVLEVQLNGYDGDWADEALLHGTILALNYNPVSYRFYTNKEPEWFPAEMICSDIRKSVSNHVLKVILDVPDSCESYFLYLAPLKGEPEVVATYPIFPDGVGKKTMRPPDHRLARHYQRKVLTCGYDADGLPKKAYITYYMVELGDWRHVTGKHIPSWFSTTRPEEREGLWKCYEDLWH